MPRRKQSPVILEDDVEFFDDHVPQIEAPQFNIAQMVESLIEQYGPKAAYHARGMADFWHTYGEDEVASDFEDVARIIAERSTK